MLRCYLALELLELSKHGGLMQVFIDIQVTFKFRIFKSYVFNETF